MDVRVLLKDMVERGGSDLYITVDSPPVVRIEGVNHICEGEPLTPPEVEALANALMTERQRAIFEESMEMNLGISSSKLGRFRVNVFRQRGAVGVVVRTIKTVVPTIDELRLPEILKEIVLTKRGLVLVTGATGSGKSTTLAAMIDYRNDTTAGHIISVEDPIEFIHQHKRCIVTQREVGFDTESFDTALKNTLRQAPDVILIGEVRDRETMEAAITFADTGHLCLATLHSNNANQAIERIMNFFPVERHAQIYLQLSLNLRAIVSQRLVPSTDGKRVPALEIMMDTPRIKDLIKKAEVDTLKEAMEQGVEEGCQTFDYVLLQLYKEGKITLEQALINADSANNLRLKIKLEGLKGDDAINALLDKGPHSTSETPFKIQGGAAGNVRPIRKT
jgi:twitching motility protein PilU